MVAEQKINTLLEELNKKYIELTKLRKNRGVSHTNEDIYFYISGRSLCEKNNSPFVRGVIKISFLKKEVVELLTKKIEEANKLLVFEKQQNIQ